jgi:hypothetical protein
MTTPTIKIHDVSTNEIVERDMNEIELNAWKINQAISITETKEKEAKAIKKAALLAKLGITEDEASLLLR